MLPDVVTDSSTVLAASALVHGLLTLYREHRDRRWKREDEEREARVKRTIDTAVRAATRELRDRLDTEVRERKLVLGKLDQCRVRLEAATRILAALVDRLPGLFTDSERTVIAEIKAVDEKVEAIHGVVVGDESAVRD